MDPVSTIIGDKDIDKGAVREILDSSLAETDFFFSKSRGLLRGLGLGGDQAAMLLACEKSRVKYKYELSQESLLYLFGLARDKGDEAPLLRLFESPFFLMKTCWLFEHAPYFQYHEKGSEALDAFITTFSREYDRLYLNHTIDTETWTRLPDPKRVRSVTFWENQIFDPIAMIDRVRRENLEGLELSVDFHPFNYTKLLPEEFSAEKRVEIREACRRCGLKIDIHSPIVGPYGPSPDPKRGKQLFFDPLRCFEIQCEVIRLAGDIDAGSVVVHLIDHANMKKMAHLVMQAEGTDVRIAFENYCQTEKRQSSEFFISAMDEISRALPDDVRRRNLGVTLDVGHFNIEGEDPLIASEKIGRWCHAEGIPIRLHATDNYGELLFNPPAFSADVHSNVSGRGINNGAVIKLLRSMGHTIHVVGEQILPLSADDINMIHGAQTFPLAESYDTYLARGEKKLSAMAPDVIIDQDSTNERAYRFLAGLD